MQSFAAAVSAPSESKPAWKVLKVLADLLELPGFHYANSEQITSEISIGNMTSEYRATSLSLKLFIEITKVFLLSNDSIAWTESWKSYCG
jgi:NADH-quinone oxidoreductase subunit G